MEHSEQHAATRKGVRLQTENVAKSIETFCAEKHIDIQKIDFDLLSYETKLIKIQEDGLRASIETPLNDELWLDQHLFISQSYVLFLRFFQPDERLVLHLGFAANKSLTSVAALIKPNSTITYFEGLEKRLVAELNKRKVRMGLFLGIYDEAMHHAIAKLCAHLKNGGKIDHEIKIPLFIGPDFSPSVDDSISYVFQQKIGSEGAAKNGVFAIKSGETIVVYTKPKAGTPSRDAKGRYLSVTEAQETNNIAFHTGEGVELIEDENGRIYRSKKTGFVVFHDADLDVKEEMEVKEVNVKTGSIDAGTDSDSKIDITDADPNSDAIADNMSVRASIVNVVGSVGINAVVVANDVTIGGQTHRSSKITAKKAHIKNHKGYLEADEAHIETLEGGSVVAKTVHIDSLLGAHIKSDECYIKNLGSNNVIEATKRIEIENPLAGDNKFLITVAAGGNDASSFVEMEKKIASLRETIMQKEDLIQKNKPHGNSQEDIAAIKAKMLKEKENNSPMANVLQAKLNHFEQSVKKIQEEESELLALKEEHKTLLGEVDALQYKILDAKIVAKNSWKGFNSAIFRFSIPPKEYQYSIDEGSSVREISLVKVGDGDYEIVAK